MSSILKFLPILLFLGGCGQTKPSPVATDPDSIMKLEEQQKKASRGE